MTEHELRCDPEEFQAILDGVKTCEIRWNDRDFQVGHILRLREYERHFVDGHGPTPPNRYTGRAVRVQVTHVVYGRDSKNDAKSFGLPAGLVAMSICPAGPPPEGPRSLDEALADLATRPRAPYAPGAWYNEYGDQLELHWAPGETLMVGRGPRLDLGVDPEDRARILSANVLRLSTVDGINRMPRKPRLEPSDA